MTQSSTLSERVSRKIRELDTAQSRLTETLTRVNLVINRTNAIDGIKHALAGEDFEGAARYVKSYYDLADSTAPEDGPAQTPQAEEQGKVSSAQCAQPVSWMRCAHMHAQKACYPHS